MTTVWIVLGAAAVCLAALAAWRLPKANQTLQRILAEERAETERRRREFAETDDHEDDGHPVHRSRRSSR